jgi:hypothetical protein
MLSFTSTRMLPTLLLALVLYPSAALAGIHTWDVREVFSNADGTIQFVELWESAGGNFETGVGTGSMSSNTQSFAIGAGAVAPPTGFKFYLLGTAAFAALPGAPTPDAIIPAGSVPFFNTAGDTVSFVGWDSWAFGAVPTNGTDSLDRLTGVGANSPTNYAGVTGSVDASPAEVPSVSLPVLSIGTLLLLVVGVGTLAARRRR